MLEIVALLVAALWLGAGLMLGWGWARFEGVRRSSESLYFRERDWPLVSLIIAARDEAASIPMTLSHLSNLAYPNFEIILVNDRSRDGTGQIALRWAETLPTLRVVNVDHLPAEWLGKTHALHEGYRISRGEWLCFMDADVALEPDCMNRSIAIATERGLDHLSLFPALEVDGIFEGAFVMAFAFYFGAYVQPWKAKDPDSKKFCGVGAFNLIRRDTCEAIGTHRKLRMDVADDLKLGKLVKRNGYRQDAMKAEGLVHLRWQRGGLKGYIRGIEKNAFAGLDYSVFRVVAVSAGVIMMSVFPFLGLFLADTITRWASGASVTMLALAYWPLTKQFGRSPLYFLTHPLGALVLLAGIWRSTVKALWRGSIIWRGTTYPLKLLRKHLV